MPTNLPGKMLASSHLLHLFHWSQDDDQDFVATASAGWHEKGQTNNVNTDLKESFG